MGPGNKHFIRAATYDLVDGKLVVTDPHRPRMITMDPWPEMLFAAADGQRTVAQFTAELKQQWGDGAPADLSEQVAAQLGPLVEEGLVKLVDHPQDLPPYLASPKSEQDPKTMRQQMIADGFIEESRQGSAEG